MRDPLPHPRWAKIEALYLSAAELPPATREQFLEAECGPDRDLHQEVLSLLTFGDQDPPELVNAIRASAASVIQEEPVTGRLLGSYRIERELGRGGMAVVYLGVRADGHFEKEVAIKLIKRGMDTAAVIGRLRRERHILAALDHPYIAHLLDGGSTPQGLPYLVMEFVEGLPIDEYCEQRHLAIPQRCDLIAKVCEAVAYAHRKLVVHRDLKPANILVATDGSPKLLDFGLAKILDAAPDGGETVNVPHSRPMTPDYASPEQLRGEELTTATDVYSLGVILYELLAGVRPHRVDHGDPPRPSSVAGSRRRLEGDLDNIVMKAMHKDAERRYPSVDHLAADLRRFLESRPVLARTDSVWYRTRKFVRRRKFAVMAGGAILASLIGGMVIATVQARKAEAARSVAEQRLVQIVNLSDRSLSGVYPLMERLPGAVPARRELIENSLGILESLSRNSTSNQTLRIALAKAYLRLGDLQGGPDAVSMGDIVEAIHSYRAGLDLLQGISLVSMARSDAMTWMEMTRKIARLQGVRDAPGATAILLQALKEIDKLPAAELADREFARARSALILALSRVNHVDLLRARQYAAAYFDASTALLKHYPDDPGARYDLSVAQVEQGYISLTRGDLESSVAYYESAMRARERLAWEFPADNLYSRALLLSYEHLAEIYGGPEEPNLGNADLARTYYQKAKPLLEAATRDPQDADAMASYAAFLSRYASVETLPEHSAGAIESLRRSAAIFESLRPLPGGGMNERPRDDVLSTRLAPDGHGQPSRRLEGIHAFAGSRRCRSGRPSRSRRLSPGAGG